MQWHDAQGRYIVDVGYRLCTQTLGSINTSLTNVLSQVGYDYLIPTPPTTGDDQTFHTLFSQGSGHRGSFSGGLSSRFSGGSGRSSTRGQSPNLHQHPVLCHHLFLQLLCPLLHIHRLCIRSLHISMLVKAELLLLMSLQRLTSLNHPHPPVHAGKGSEDCSY